MTVLSEAQVQEWRAWIVRMGGQDVPSIIASHEVLRALLAAAEAKVVTLTEALREYGQHYSPCHLSVTNWRRDGVCSCGFRAALGGQAAPETERHPAYNADPTTLAGQRCVCGGIRYWHGAAPHGCDDCDCSEFRPIHSQSEPT